MDAPQENLTRTVAFSEFTSTRDDNGDGQTLEGYGAVFNQDTVIDSWEGNFVERIAPGAFRKTLRDRKPVMQFDHGRDTRVGSTPIGAFEVLKEDETGLFARARLHDNEQVKPVRDAIASGAIDGMSFRFSVTREKWDEPADAASLPTRTIQEVKLFELGPVVFPAYAGTSVGVRSQFHALLEDPEMVNELKRALNLTSDDAPAPADAESTSERDAADTSDEAADTSPDDAARSDTEHTEEPDPAEEREEEHPAPEYSPAERPQMPAERRARDLAEVRQLVAAASAKDT